MLVTLFGIPIKNIAGSVVGVFLPDVILLLLLLNVIASKIAIAFTVLDKYFIALFGYVVLHGVIVSVFSGLDGYFDKAHLADYRNFFSALVIFIAVRMDFLKDPGRACLNYERIFKVYAAILIIDIFFEYFLYKIIGMNLTFLTWHPSNIPVSISTGVGSTEIYGEISANTRIPTIYGYPHPAGIMAGSLFFCMLVMYYFTGDKVNKYLMLLLGFSVFFAESRLQILAMIGAIFLGRKVIITTLYSGRRFDLFTRAAVYLAMVFFLLIVIYLYRDRMRMSSEGDFILFMEVLSMLDWEGISGFIVVPDFQQMIVGIGPFGGSKVYGNLWEIGKIESGILAEMLPKYGVLFVVLYFIFLYKMYRFSRFMGLLISFFPLVPFLISPAHFWLLNKTGITHYFGMLSGVLISLLYSRNKLLMCAWRL